MLKQEVTQLLDVKVEEMLEGFQRTTTKYEQEVLRFGETDQQNNSQHVVFNHNNQVSILVLPADVQQLVLIPQDTTEEWRSGGDQQNPEPLHIKEEEEEELCTSVKEEQLNVKEETDATRSLSTSVHFKTDEDEEKPLYLQFHPHHMEGRDPPTSSSADQMEAATDGEDCGAAETRMNQNLNTYEDDLDSSETEVSDEDEEKPLLSHLHQHHQVEDRDSPTSSSADWMEAVTEEEDDERPETTMTSHLNTNDDNSKSSVIEVNKDDDNDDRNDPDFQLKHKPDSGSKTENSFKGWKECRLPKSSANSTNKSLSCSECGKLFLNNCSLQRHMKSNSKVGSSSCLVTNKCLKVGKTEQSLSKVQTTQKSFTCEECGKIFIRKGELNKHTRTHRREKLFVCELCGHRFNLKKYLNRHERIHTGQKPFACDVCEQRFNNKNHLNTHMMSHTGQKPFACDVCEQRFTRITNLNRHMRIHTGEKPFACDVCEQRFNNKHHLNTHMMSHTGQKLFACGVCEQRFNYKTHVNTHMIIHTGQKPFACDVCGQRFNRKTNLNRHMMIHTGNKTMVCNDSSSLHKN